MPGSATDSATSVENVVATSQVAFPEEMFAEIYALDTYAGSAENLAGVGSLDADNIFSDGWELQVPTVTGSVDDGYVGTAPRPRAEPPESHTRPLTRENTLLANLTGWHADGAPDGEDSEGA